MLAHSFAHGIGQNHGWPNPKQQSGKAPKGEGDRGWHAPCSGGWDRILRRRGGMRGWGMGRGTKIGNRDAGKMGDEHKRII